MEVLGMGEKGEAAGYEEHKFHIWYNFFGTISDPYPILWKS